MSLEKLQAAVGDLQGKSLCRIRCADIHAACLAIPEAKRDRYHEAIHLGAVRGLVSPVLTRMGECLAEINGNPELLEREHPYAWIEARAARHLLALAEPAPSPAAAVPVEEPRPRKRAA